MGGTAADPYIPFGEEVLPGGIGQSLRADGGEGQGGQSSDGDGAVVVAGLPDRGKGQPPEVSAYHNPTLPFVAAMDVRADRVIRAVIPQPPRSRSTWDRAGGRGGPSPLSQCGQDSEGRWSEPLIGVRALSDKVVGALRTRIDWWCPWIVVLVSWSGETGDLAVFLGGAQGFEG
jgi:hypothetical protein